MQIPDQVKPFLKNGSLIIAVLLAMFSLASSYSSLQQKVAEHDKAIQTMQRNMATKDQVDDLKQDLRDIKNYLLDKGKK